MFQMDLKQRTGPALTCAALAVGEQGLPSHGMHAEGVISRDLRRRVLLTGGGKGGQILTQSEGDLGHAADSVVIDNALIQNNMIVIDFWMETEWQCEWSSPP